MGKPGLDTGYMVFLDRDKAEAFRLDIGQDTTNRLQSVDIDNARLEELFLKGNICHMTGPLTFSVLKAQVKRLEAHKGEQGRSRVPITEPCPMGWVRATIATSEGQIEQAWVNPTTLASPSGARSKLSAEQKDRLKKVRWQMKEHDGQTYEKWVANFEADTTPERELRIWEALARTYTAETSLRRHSKKERRQLYTALLSCRVCGSPEAAVSSHPWLKNYSRLDEVFARFQAYLSETWTADDERKYRERLPERLQNTGSVGDGQHRYGGTFS
ncbi:hypothetical protein [Limnoglobus roseus]|nr:hypothetical protein [Limnoglobus roseus]